MRTNFHRFILLLLLSLFFFNDTATTGIYTLSLHDALPISCSARGCSFRWRAPCLARVHGGRAGQAPQSVGRNIDRKSTRLNSSHSSISYAVFCLKKKTKHQLSTQITPTYFTQIFLLPLRLE